MKDDTSLISKVTSLQIFSAFHHRNFSLLFLSTLTMSIGNFMMMVALGWLVLEMTGSPLSLGMVWAARSSPHLIWGMLAGAVADKVNRQRLLIWAFVTLAVGALAIGLLISKGWIELWHVLLFTFIMGSISTFAMTTRQAFVVDIVGRKDAMGAISMNAVAMRIMGVFGGATAGVVIELFGIEWPFFIMVTGYLLGILILASIRGVAREVSLVQQSIRENFIEGLKIIGKNQIVPTLMVMAIICEILGFSYMVLLPVFARDILNIGAIGLGMLNTAQSVGGVLAALALASLGNYKYKGRLILGIFLTFGISLVLFSQSPWYPASLLLLAMVGGMAAAFDAMQHTMLQLNVTEEQRGRAMGIWQLSIGFGPVGHMIIGTIAALFSAQLAVSINGIAIVAVFFILAVFVPKLRRA
ncbi:MFS transporter [Chloroflexota bacterium]